MRQLHQPADVDEFQVSLSQAAIGVRPAHADVVVYPEGDIAAEISRRENTEEARLKIGGRDKWRYRSRRRQLRKVGAVGAGVLKILVITQPNWRKTRNRSRPNRLWPKLRVGRRAQH